jgi:hypothetical protein
MSVPVPVGVFANLLPQPLHIAVATGGKRAVKLIIDFTKYGLRLCNVDGETPLHSAVKQSFPEITKLLIDASPIEALYMENGVGETPLDIASLTELLWRIRQWFTTPSPMELGNNLSIMDTGFSFPLVDQYLKCLDVEIPKLRATLDELLRDGRLRNNTKLTNDLLAFADLMERKLVAAKAIPEEPLAEGKVDKDAKDAPNVEETLLCVRNAVAANPGLRRLVHLIDVQRSIQGNLPQYGAATQKMSHHREDDSLEPEEDKEEQQRRGSLVFKHVNTQPDGY